MNDTLRKTADALGTCAIGHEDAEALGYITDDYGMVIWVVDMTPLPGVVRVLITHEAIDYYVGAEYEDGSDTSGTLDAEAFVYDTDDYSALCAAAGRVLVAATIEVCALRVR